MTLQASMRALERDLSTVDWLAARSYRAERYAAQTLLERKTSTVSVVVPARETADTIGPLVDALMPLERLGLVDELLVVDAASEDGTAEVAARAGATVAQESALLPEFGAARGKGDAMWRGLAATHGEVVAFLDSDTEGFAPGFLLGLLGPLFEDPRLELVKGAFSRPLRVGDETRPDEGGRVTELTARPLINLHVPELAGFRQPLAGEVAARRPLLERLPFPVGYGVEIAMMIDALEEVGLGAMAQVDLGERQNRHQSLRDLGAMAYAVMVATLQRVDPARADDAGPFVQSLGESLEMREVPTEERPPLASLREAALP